ncbi:VOC family protein [Halalkalibacter sp. APA_J-10(15)]|uniref:VOC family protein n=1 Tax=Halalkalibacter sp. APA_J-10(15) TaxID=2933805 RepID=UPI001FF4E983|nr:VOC family protein [Halalkalibacter sp. APA_J-10(15)]MCK0472303.1 VOC family protein [Halalkalibacter sp. APA_J-10(15)]
MKGYGGDTMITRAIQMTIFVRDRQKAKAFYTEKLGFTVRDEVEFSPGFHYLTVSPNKNNETVIELVQANTEEEMKLIGKQAGEQIVIMFQSNDIEKDYLEMKGRGVVFHSAPQDVPGGKGAGFEDLYGNKYDLFQPEKNS